MTKKCPTAVVLEQIHGCEYYHAQYKNVCTENVNVYNLLECKSKAESL